MRSEKFKKNKTKPYNKRVAFICNTRTINKDMCCFKSIREDELLDVIFKIIKVQIMLAKNFNDIISKTTIDISSNINKIQTKIDNKTLELNKIKNAYETIYIEYLEKFLTEQDYIFIKNKYKIQEKNIIDEIKILKKDLKIEKNKTQENSFLKSFLEFKNNEKLTKQMISSLIKEIKVYDDKKIEIHFKFKQEFDILNEYVSGLEEVI